MNEMTRRTFVHTVAAGSAGLLMTHPLRAVAGSMTRKKYAIVGTGGRSYMYQKAIYDNFKETSELVGLCDVNVGRLKAAQVYAESMQAPQPPIYRAEEFDRMIKETRPDTVIVTTVDGFHHQYIVRALELGKDVITEKPMTTEAGKVQKIIDAQRKSGKRVRVTFNYRYAPARTQVKELLMSGVIGDILSVDFHWMLNTHHGADYFRRWHSQKKFSGGLMVHKASHHFDLVNWWMSAIPVRVQAVGKREFYTPAMAKRMGLSGSHERCRTCPEKAQCAFELDLEKNSNLKRLYLDNESYDGYYRDRCVFRPDIDIEDTMNVLVRYDNNATLCYSLNAFNAWEGMVVIFNGSKGRLEHKAEESVYISGDGTVQGALKGDGIYTRVYPLRQPAYEIKVWEGEGGHGGGDDVMLAEIFGSDAPADKYQRSADHRSGAYSCLTGIAANKCFRSGKSVAISSLVKNLAYPDYPPMPTHEQFLGMPAKNARA